MNPTLIKLGSFELRWYSFLLLIAFISGFLLVIKQRNKLNLIKEEITNFLFYLIIFCIIGARIYYCLFEYEYYFANPADIIKVWEGGLAIHGGIISGVIYIAIYCYIKKINILKVTDICVPPLVLGQAIGRWGNFFNGEAYGNITTYEALKSMHLPKFIIDGMYIDSNYRIPTFLYESIWCIIIFILLVVIIRLKKDKMGIITSIYLIMYGIERFIVEKLRTDSLMLGSFRVAQIISIIMIIIGISILFLIFRKRDVYDK